MRKLIPAIVVVVLAIGAFWFFSHRGDRSGLLAHVPADTPWVVANTQPLPEQVLEAWRGMFEGLSPMYQSMLQDARDALDADVDDPRLVGLIEALHAEFGDGDVLAGYERIGLDIAPQMVFFGHGLVPVLRVVLADAGRFDAFLDRLEAATGELSPRVVMGGHEVRRVTLGDLPVDVLVGILDDQLVATLAPREAGPEALEALFGIRAPERSLADSGDLRRLHRTYSYQPHYSGYLDLRQLAAHVMAPATAIEAGFLAALEFEKPEPSPTCRAEFEALAEAWPRLTMGYTRLDAKVQEVRFVAETRKDIAEALVGLRAPMPGPAARAEDSLLDIGLALRLDKLPAAVNRYADAVRAQPWQCESLQGLNEAFAQSRQQMSNPGLFMAAGLLHSLYLSVDDYAAPATGDGMPDVSGILAIGSENPASLVAMGQAFVPQLATSGLATDRQPRALSLGAYGVDMPAEVVMSETALAVAVGETAVPRLSSALVAGDSGQPMLLLAMDGRLYEHFGQVMQAQLAQLADIDPEVLEAMDEDSRRELEALRAESERLEREAVMMGQIYSQVFKRLQIEVTASEHGLEMKQRMQLR